MAYRQRQTDPRPQLTTENFVKFGHASDRHTKTIIAIVRNLYWGRINKPT